MVVAIIDDGISKKYLRSPVINYVVSGEVVNSDGCTISKKNHGTLCAQIIEQHGNVKKIISLRLSNISNPNSLQELCTAIEWCIKSDVDIVNMSVGIAQFQHFGRSFIRLWNACSNASQKGVILVAARSNVGYPTIPADFPMVNSVSSLSEYKKDRKQSDYYTIGRIKYLLSSEKTSGEFGNSYACAFITAMLTKNKSGSKKMLPRFMVIHNRKCVLKYSIFSKEAVVFIRKDMEQTARYLLQSNRLHTRLSDGRKIITYENRIDVYNYFFRNNDKAFAFFDRQIPTLLKILLVMCHVRYWYAQPLCQIKNQNGLWIQQKHVPVIYLYGKTLRKFRIAEVLAGMFMKEGYVTELVSSCHVAWLYGISIAPIPKSDVVYTNQKDDVVVFVGETSIYKDAVDFQIEVTNKNLNIIIPEIIVTYKVNELFQKILQYYEKEN